MLYINYFINRIMTVLCAEFDKKQLENIISDEMPEIVRLVGEYSVELDESMKLLITRVAKEWQRFYKVDPELPKEVAFELRKKSFLDFVISIYLFFCERGTFSKTECADSIISVLSSIEGFEDISYSEIESSLCF